MKDAVSVDRVKLLHPSIRDEVADLIGKIEFANPSFRIRVVQGLRTIEEQDALYAKGRTAPGPIVTKARGGSSFHNYGLAIDFALLYDKDGNGTFETLSWDTAADIDGDKVADWMEVVKTFKAAGYEWGGDWTSIKDDPHFQKSFGHKWQDLYKLFKDGKFIAGTRYVVL